jgi:hypothetical protein
MNYNLNILTFNEAKFARMQLNMEVLDVLNIKYDEKEFEEICFFLFKENSKILNEKVIKKLMLLDS